MKLLHPFLHTAVLTLLLALTHATPVQSADAPSLTDVKTPADLAAKITANTDAATKLALKNHTAAILAAAAKKPHVDFVIAALDKAPGTYTKTNTTPADLRQALGRDSEIFDTLTLVNLASSTLNIKAKRETDPFDQAFYEHLGNITELQSLQILHTTAQNDWLAPLANLHALTNISIVNQSKLNDLGLAHLAGLKQLVRLAYVGTSTTGRPFTNFHGWTQLKSSSFRGSQIDDAGLQALCEAFPNYESLSLAHAKFTDAAALHLGKLTKLKGLELGSTKATSKSLQPLVNLPLEYFQLGEGVDAPAALSIIKDFKSLKRLTLTNCKDYTDADLQIVAGLKTLEHVELGSLPITAERVSALKIFAFLKSMRIIRGGTPYPPEILASIKAALPNLALKFD